MSAVVKFLLGGGIGDSGIAFFLLALSSPAGCLTLWVVPSSLFSAGVFFFPSAGIFFFPSAGVFFFPFSAAVLVAAVDLGVKVAGVITRPGCTNGPMGFPAVREAGIVLGTLSPCAGAISAPGHWVIAWNGAHPDHSSYCHHAGCCQASGKNMAS
jgi:hypothetical protein